MLKAPLSQHQITTAANLRRKLPTWSAADTALNRAALVRPLHRELGAFRLAVALAGYVATDFGTMLLQGEFHHSTGRAHLKREIPALCLSVFNRVLLGCIGTRRARHLVAFLLQHETSGTRCAITRSERAGPRARGICGNQRCCGECNEKKSLHNGPPYRDLSHGDCCTRCAYTSERTALSVSSTPSRSSPSSTAPLSSSPPP